MKIKMIAGPRPGQMDMVVTTTHGTISADMGQTLELPDEAGHQVMAKWPACFEVVASSVAVEDTEDGLSFEGKMAKGYKNKAVTSKE